jgi:hypothetical protein
MYHMSLPATGFDQIKTPMCELLLKCNVAECAPSHPEQCPLSYHLPGTLSFTRILLGADADRLCSCRQDRNAAPSAYCSLTETPLFQDAFGADFDDFTSATVALGLGYLIVHDDGGCSHWEIPVMLANNLQVHGRYEAGC